MRKRIICCLVFFLILFFFFTFNSSAHVGGGPPFLLVNGKYAPTNPYYQGPTTLNIAQDLAPDTYLANTPVHMGIDLAQFLSQTAVPLGQGDAITFRWSFYFGDTFGNGGTNQQFGKNIDHTFNTVGSYLVLVEAKAPFEQDYITIDAVLVHIAPKLPYHPPQFAVSIQANTKTENAPVTFTLSQTIDPSVKQSRVFWEVEGKTLQEGDSLTETFSDLKDNSVEYLYVRLIDGNGIASDIGFLIEKYHNKLRFQPFGNMSSVPIRITNSDGKTVQTFSDPFSLLATLPPVVALVVMLAAVLFLILIVPIGVAVVYDRIVASQKRR